MKPFTWDPRKNERLIRERGISFGVILWSIQSGGLLDTIDHRDPRKYPGPRIYVVKALDYVFLVPFEEKEQEIIFKTIIPSRKAVRDYLKGGSVHEDQVG